MTAIRRKYLDRKDLIRKYKETPRPAGVYRVHNTVNGKSLIGTSLDLPGMLNRQRFQLERSSHANSELQKDWNDFGSDAFTFEILDQLEPSSKGGYEPSEDLRVLLQMWIEKLEASEQPLYKQSTKAI